LDCKPEHEEKDILDIVKIWLDIKGVKEYLQMRAARNISQGLIGV
jgi:hypothetical protein